MELCAAIEAAIEAAKILFFFFFLIMKIENKGAYLVVEFGGEVRRVHLIQYSPK